MAKEDQNKTLGRRLHCRVINTFIRLYVDPLDMLLDQRKNAAMIYSMWSGYRKKDDVKRLIGVFEQRNCPTYTLHTSGHADSNAIAQLVNTVAPKEIVYVHGET